jgi:hypothetical protein
MPYGLPRAPQLGMSAHAAGQKSDFLAFDTIELFVDQAQRLIPSDRLTLVTIAQQRLAHTVRIVVGLNASLSKAAHLAAIDRRGRIALQLQHATFAYTPGDAATGVTLRASRIEIYRDAGNRIFRQFQLGIRSHDLSAILYRGITASAQCDSGAPPSQHLQKISSIKTVFNHH